MFPHGMIVGAVLSGWLISMCVNSVAESLASSKSGEANLRSFAARGVVRELKADGRTILLSHETITNYMDAMTMPFRVKEPKELTDLRPGDQVSFRLSVSNTESWIDQVASFLTGSAESVGELARSSDIEFEREAGSFNHNFRTLIIDAAGHLQMVFPTGGDLSGAIADEILKATAVTNRPP